MFLLVSPHSVSRSVVSNSWRPHGLYPGRFLCPWNSPGKNIGVGCHFPSLGGLPDPGIEPWVSCIAGKFFTIWATREALFPHKGFAFPFVCQASSFPLITAAETKQVFLLGVPAPSHPSLEAPQPPGRARTEQLTGLWHHKIHLCCVFPGH